MIPPLGGPVHFRGAVDTTGASARGPDGQAEMATARKPPLRKRAIQPVEAGGCSARGTGRAGSTGQAGLRRGGGQLCLHGETPQPFQRNQPYGITPEPPQTGDQQDICQVQADVTRQQAPQARIDELLAELLELLQAILQSEPLVLLAPGCGLVAECLLLQSLDDGPISAMETAGAQPSCSCARAKPSFTAYGPSSALPSTPHHRWDCWQRGPVWPGAFQQSRCPELHPPAQQAAQRHSRVPLHQHHPRPRHH